MVVRVNKTCGMTCECGCASVNKTLIYVVVCCGECGCASVVVVVVRVWLCECGCSECGCGCASVSCGNNNNNTIYLTSIKKSIADS